MHQHQLIVIHAIRLIITILQILSIKHSVFQQHALSATQQIPDGNQQRIHNMMPSHFQFIPAGTEGNGQIVLNVIQIHQAMPHSAV
jgi:hypothetical protein